MGEDDWVGDKITYIWSKPAQGESINIISDKEVNILPPHLAQQRGSINSGGLSYNPPTLLIVQWRNVCVFSSMVAISIMG